MITKGKWVLNVFHIGVNNKPILQISATAGYSIAEKHENLAFCVACANQCQAVNPDNPQAVADNIESVIKEAREVMAELELHGSSIVAHLLDTDDNAGQRLREVLSAIKAKE